VKVVKIADLKNNLSRHLERVRKGGEITVLDRQTPVARIVPFAHGDRAARATPGTGTTGGVDRIADLTRQGIVSPGDPRAVSRWLDGRPPIRRPPGSPSAVDVLLRMRRDSTR
jgi:prevent-host-death family protein